MSRARGLRVFRSPWDHGEYRSAAWGQCCFKESRRTDTALLLSSEWYITVQDVVLVDPDLEIKDESIVM